MQIRTEPGTRLGMAMRRASKKREYGEACAAAHTLDVVRERWALLVVCELVLGAKRLTDLRTGLPAVSTNVLADRLGVAPPVRVLPSLAPPIRCAVAGEVSLMNKGQDMILAMPT